MKKKKKKNCLTLSYLTIFFDQTLHSTKRYSNQMSHSSQSRIDEMSFDEMSCTRTHDHQVVNDYVVYMYIKEFRGRRHRTCWGKITGATIRTWLLNKFISFLAVLSWKTGLKKNVDKVPSGAHIFQASAIPCNGYIFSTDFSYYTAK